MTLANPMQRLKGLGLVRDHDGLFLTWTKRPNHQRVGYCSALMRVIAISSVMDSARVPELVTDYVLYHELLHMEDGLSFSNRHHGSGFRQRERRFPGWEEAERHPQGVGQRTGDKDWSSQTISHKVAIP